MKGKSKQTKIPAAVVEPALAASEYQFVLKPLTSDCYFSSDISLSLYPEYHKKQKNYFNIWPQIYNEGKDYMPFFVLETDRESLAKKQTEYKQTQIQRLNNALESKAQILVPHPGKTRHTCFVCKSHFNDYKTHVQSKAHRTKLRASKSEEVIRELISVVQEENKQESLSIVREPSTNLAPPNKRLMNEWKLKDLQFELISNLNEIDQGEEVEFQIIDLDAENDLEEMKFKQPTEPSLNKHEENQTLLNYYTSNLQSFRVSDYLI